MKRRIYLASQMMLD